MTAWQDEQHAALDKIFVKFSKLPERIARDLTYGRFYTASRLVDNIDGERTEHSAHGTAEKLIRELAEDVDALLAPQRKIEEDG
jgi:hypothetical protein